jgi:superfamily II DNA or RNA helicase
MDAEAVLAAVRKAASPRVWSSGVSIARGQRVLYEGQSGNEVTLRVTVPAQPVPHVVVIDVVDHAWSCDCPSREDPCAHVAAAAIALKEADKGSTTLTTSTRPRLGLEYRLTSGGATLAVARWVVTVGEAASPVREILGSTVQALVSERRASVDFVLVDGDLELDRFLERTRRKPLDSRQLAELVGLLDRHPRVYVDDVAVAVDRSPLMPRGVVRRERDQLVFSVVPDPSLTSVLAPGVALAGGALRLMGEGGLCGARWEKLPMVERFAKRDWAELVGERIPLMEARFPIDVETKDLPRLVLGEHPRIELGLRMERGRLSVSPELVYGRPPRLVIERGRPQYVQGPVPRRDQGAEHDLLLRLRDELNLVPGRRVELAGTDAQGFMEKLRAWNKASDDAAEEFDLALRPEPVRPRLELEGARFDVVFETGEGEQAARADATAVLEAWQGGFNQVPLLDGGFAPLPVDWLETHGPRLMALLSARRDGEVPPALLPDLARLAESLDAPPPPGLARLAPLLGDFTGLPRAPRPADLTAELRHYQQVGVDWLAFLRSAGLGAVLADDMGLGKTLQTICVLSGKSLVVCPTSVVHNWVRELGRFRPELRVCTYHGPRRVLDAEADVVVTTYALMRLDQASLGARTWDVVVLDEAQAIKNPESQSARAAFELRAKFRVSLSGTPLENRLEELWSQLHFTNPGLLGGRRDFDQRYAKPIGEGHPGRAAELRQRIRPFVLRRLKAQVAPELPPRTDMVVYAELSDSERAVYDSVKLATREDVLAQLAGGGSVLGALEALLRLRQAACHPSLVPGQHAETSSKVELLVETLSEVVAEGHRALVFSQWTGLLDLLEVALDRAGLARLRLDGSTTDRASLVEQFQSGQGPSVFIISLKAGGTGLNLTAADHVFFLDPWWNPAVEQQAADRAHRIGQTRPVFVHRLVAKDTVEEKILVLQDKKRQLADVALGEAGAAAQLTRDDLLSLLE